MTKAIFKKKFSDFSSEVKELEPLLQDSRYNREKVNMQINIIKKGLRGERELGYFLSNTYEEIFCLHNVMIYNKNHRSQLDYVVLTKNCIWILESKSLSGKLKVLRDGQLIREKGSCERYPLVQANIQMQNLKEYLLRRNLITRDIEIKYRVVFTDTDSKVNVTYENDEIKKHFINVELVSSLFKNTSSLKENLTLNEIDRIAKDLIYATSVNKDKFERKVNKGMYLNSLTNDYYYGNETYKQVSPKKVSKDCYYSPPTTKDYRPNNTNKNYNNNYKNGLQDSVMIPILLGFTILIVFFFIMI